MSSESDMNLGGKESGGSIPDGWKLKTVGEFSNVKRGASPRPIKDPNWWGGSVGWVRISDVTSSRKYLTKTTQYLSNEGVEKSVKIKQGEVVLSICATIGRPIIINVDACIHDGFVWFDKLENSISREYWYYFLASKEEFLGAQRQSGTQGNLNTSIVSDLPCLLPPLPEQKKIAAILSSVDDVIEKTQAQINKLKDLKTGMMQELLSPREGTGQPQGVGKNGKGHTEFKDSPIGRIPVGWSVVSISKHVLETKSGASLKPSDFSDEGFEVIPKKSVQFGGKLITDNKTYCTRSYAESTPKSIVDKTYIVTVLRDLVPTGPNIGLIVEIDGNTSYLMAQGVYGFKLDDDLHGGYLAQLSNTDWYRREMRKILVGSTQVHIRSSEFFEVMIPKPTIEEQVKIHTLLDSVDTKINSLRKKVNSLSGAKKGLMQELLTGKIRVKVDQ